MNRFTHFEFVTSDFEKTAAFYRQAFGWQFQKWEGPVEYWMVTTGEEGTRGINGGLMAANGGPFSGTINTIEVEDIDAAIERVKAAGGEILMNKDVIPEVGYLAYFRDNCGIVVGLHQPDPQVRMAG